jgi:hypothetical protein
MCNHVVCRDKLGQCHANRESPVRLFSNAWIWGKSLNINKNRLKIAIETRREAVTP